MATPCLSTTLLREVMDLFERSQPVFGSDGERLQGVPAWDFLDHTGLSAAEIGAWTTRVGYAGSYPVPFGDERVPVDLEEDDDPAWYGYQCPETFRWTRVPADRVAVHEVRAEGLVDYLGDLLDIPLALRPRVSEPLLGGSLWYLGRAHINAAPVEMWLVRRLYRCLADLLRYFNDPLRPDHGLILVAGFGLPEVVRPPRNYRVVRLDDALIDGVATPTLDRHLLRRILEGPVDVVQRSSLPVEFDGRRTLTIRTIAEPWTLTGQCQRAAVVYLYQQYLNDRHWLPAKEILDAAANASECGRSRTMSHLFSGNAHWETYITRAGGDSGMYGFRLD